MAILLLNVVTTNPLSKVTDKTSFKMIKDIQVIDGQNDGIFLLKVKNQYEKNKYNFVDI